MNAEVWVAIFAALIAGAALYVSWRSERSAARAARAAENQTKIQQQALAIAEEQTKVLQAAARTAQRGPTFAENIRVKVDPPLPVID